MNDTEKPNPLSDVEMALLDSIKVLIEIMLSKGIASQKELEYVFSVQRDIYIQKKIPNSAAVIEMLRTFSVKQEAQRKLRDVPPAGTA